MFTPFLEKPCRLYVYHWDGWREGLEEIVLL
jgi:hypothetical protein